MSKLCGGGRCCNDYGTCWSTYEVNIENGQKLVIKTITISKKKATAPSISTSYKIMLKNKDQIQTLLQDVCQTNCWSLVPPQQVKFEIYREFTKPGTYYIQGLVNIPKGDFTLDQLLSYFRQNYEVSVDYYVETVGGGKPVDKPGSKTPIFGDIAELWQTLNTAAKVIIILIVIWVTLILRIPQKLLELRR